MPIQAPTLAAAVETFKNHLYGVLTKTVTQTKLVQVRREGSNRFALGFRKDGQAISAPIQTRFGPMGLSIGQLCEGVPVEDGFRLTTVQYRYALNQEGTDEPWMRWEYVKVQKKDDKWCRHHLQGDLTLPVGSLNDFHLPTGYVTIEEVLRFCINDLGVSPLSAGWDKVLQDSYQKFKEEFG